MVPVSLKLENFMSFASMREPVDFTLFKLICVVGPNGAGKSSLIEAMRWALFGKGRVSNPELVRKGTNRMSVDFVFKLDNDIYKIRRTYFLSQRKEKLAISTITPEGEFVVTDSRGKRAAQRYIEKLLGMNDHSFCNASFITQGNSGSFTRQMKPSERKELLASVLELHKFDLLAEKAKGERKTFVQKIDFLTAEQERLKTELLDKKQLELQFAETERRKGKIWSFDG